MVKQKRKHNAKTDVSGNEALRVTLPSDELIKYIISIRDNAFKKRDGEYFKGQLIACDSIIVFINMLSTKSEGNDR